MERDPEATWKDVAAITVFMVSFVALILGAIWLTSHGV